VLKDKKSKKNLNVCQKKKKFARSIIKTERKIHALDIPFCIIVVVYIMFVKELMAHRDYKDRLRRRLIKMIEMQKSHYLDQVPAINVLLKKNYEIFVFLIHRGKLLAKTRTTLNLFILTNSLQQIKIFTLSECS
jgi:hypothetical protein